MLALLSCRQLPPRYCCGMSCSPVETALTRVAATLTAAVRSAVVLSSFPPYHGSGVGGRLVGTAVASAVAMLPCCHCFVTSTVVVLKLSLLCRSCCPANTADALVVAKTPHCCQGVCCHIGGCHVGGCHVGTAVIWAAVISPLLSGRLLPHR